ncbi:hypothetical protein U9K52_08460 [Chryseobacterium sp. MHB01]|uniref:hypothetical protein n=1 Tax=Chryseobacterium sp. MHB01 TaxID=3109433 RepID=UPI002AFE6A8E|nr:hypothetical protein [Chryseobacterium sp. MHB01]MEA1848940.1 hypothetical protein [Chryseobacterium sp. MHB01]
MATSLKRQNGKIVYANIAALQARTGFVADESYDVEVKTVSTDIADLVYNQKNDTLLADDGIVCIHSTSDNGGSGVKWLRADSKSVGSFSVTTTVDLEGGAEFNITGVTASGILAANFYHFSRLNDATGLELIEEPTVTADGFVTVKLRNASNVTVASGAVITFNWAELGKL